MAVAVNCGNSSLMLFESLKIANTILEIIKTETEKIRKHVYGIECKGILLMPILQGEIRQFLSEKFRESY